MPTLPHQFRQVAESFGLDAERYDQARPRYPDALVAAIVGREVLDVGCGTGIAARQFQAAGRSVLGVEPDARMAEFARRTGVEVEETTFETWDPAGRTFDAVVAGQSWHWVDPVAGAAKAARVLRPGGALTLFWHVFQPPPEVAEAFAVAYRRVAPDSPLNAQQGADPYDAIVTKAADGMREVGGFGPPERWRFEWTRTYTRDEWLNLIPTTGGLTTLAADKVAEVLESVGTAIDAMGGSFTMQYVTVAVSASYRAGNTMPSE